MNFNSKRTRAGRRPRPLLRSSATLSKRLMGSGLRTGRGFDRCVEEGFGEVIVIVSMGCSVRVATGKGGECVGKQ
jgi:hypothetical protein